MSAMENSVIDLVGSYQKKLAQICIRRRVKSLELFGSAAGGRFDETRSDLDFLVEFGELRSGGYAEAYFGLLEDLEDLFQRRVDLVMISAIDNPFFLENIKPSRILLYAA